MPAKRSGFRAMISSDWSECLAPCGPFDPLFFLYPDLRSPLTEIFRLYTSNRIPLGEAARRVRDMDLTVTEEQMDRYLESSFSTYTGVAALIEECLRRDILFMINTTAFRGYFQRIFSKGFLPGVPALAANPLIAYPGRGTDPGLFYEIMEIQDKPRRTEAAMNAFSIPAERVVLIGDSGGDGPHFEWGSSIGAFLIASMCKPSLDAYCTERDIPVNLRFGRCYQEGEARDIEAEGKYDFSELIPVIGRIAEP